MIDCAPGANTPHGCILALGLAVKSYLDTGNRTAFVNGGAYLQAYPDFKSKHWTETCVPLNEQGPEVYRRALDVQES